MDVSTCAKNGYLAVLSTSPYGPTKNNHISKYRGHGCVLVGRVVAPSIRDPWFVSQHRQSFSNAFICAYLSIAIQKRQTCRKK